MARHQIADELANGVLVPLRCKDMNDLPQMRVAAVWSTRKAPSPILAKFIDLLEAECRVSVIIHEQSARKWSGPA